MSALLKYESVCDVALCMHVSSVFVAQLEQMHAEQSRLQGAQSQEHGARCGCLLQVQGGESHTALLRGPPEVQTLCFKISYHIIFLLHCANDVLC